MMRLHCKYMSNVALCIVSSRESQHAKAYLNKDDIGTGFPLGLENLEKWEGIFQSGKSQGILNRLEKSGKITQNTGKY